MIKYYEGSGFGISQMKYNFHATVVPRLFPKNGENSQRNVQGFGLFAAKILISHNMT